ncbi:hypothetical protein [Roseibium sp. M-1]
MSEVRFDATVFSISCEEFGTTIGFSEEPDGSGQYVILIENETGCYLELNDQIYSSYGDVSSAALSGDEVVLQLNKGFVIDGKQHRCIKIRLHSFPDGPEPLRAALNLLI